MTYSGFLLYFLVVPIVLLLGLAWWDGRQGRQRVAWLQGWPVWSAIVLHVFVAVAYTTPWDNYLVATRVWWYDPALVTGITIGWVPIEEYTFFVLQPILGGLWLWHLSRRLTLKPRELRPSLRMWGTLPLGAIWVGAVAVLVSGWGPGTYLGLELAWALPPIMLQLAFGADILWSQRRMVLLSLLPTTLFLSAADTLAISGGTWTINPEKSLNLLIGGVLPVEELVFFLLTNTLVTFGITLIWSEASHNRFLALKGYLSRIDFRPRTESH